MQSNFYHNSGCIKEYETKIDNKKYRIDHHYSEMPRRPYSYFPQMEYYYILYIDSPFEKVSYGTKDLTTMKKIKTLLEEKDMKGLDKILHSSENIAITIEEKPKFRC